MTDKDGWPELLQHLLSASYRVRRPGMRGLDRCDLFKAMVADPLRESATQCDKLPVFARVSPIWAAPVLVVQP